ncbi:hypothetical protein K438DRAFT_1937707 [Mycena galopus ATCC 62051]|nr:hypothetical protein K438DRAFT_1937707 [Mycena galopus ATCC 62051]
MNGTGVIFRLTSWRLAFAAPAHPYPQSRLFDAERRQRSAASAQRARLTADAKGGRVDAAVYTVIVCSESELAIVSCTVVRGGWQERLWMGFMPAEDTAAEADGEDCSRVQASTGEQGLTGNEEVSTMRRGAPHEGDVGGGRMGASGEETGRTISAGVTSADKYSYSVLAP